MNRKQKCDMDARIIATAQLMVVLDATVVPNTRPPNQRSNEQSDVHLEQRPRHSSAVACTVTTPCQLHAAQKSQFGVTTTVTK